MVYLKKLIIWVSFSSWNRFTKKEIEKRLQIVASAGNLSRAEGTVSKVLYTHKDYQSNLKLARAIVGYGHKSISEHDYLVFPGGGTQFKDGVSNYIDFIEKV